MSPFAGKLNRQAIRVTARIDPAVVIFVRKAPNVFRGDAVRDAESIFRTGSRDATLTCPA